MLLLVGVGFVAGLVTALSPCVLPVLPIVLAGGATGRRPLAIIAGLVASFTVFTLFAAWLLDSLGLPEDLLRNLAIALLFLVAATLLFPRLGELASRPLERLSRRPAADLGGGVLLGASLGLVFVPCAGPVLAAITVLAARQEVGLDGIALTLSYAVGAAVPLLALAYLGKGIAARLKEHALAFRRGAGVLIAAAAAAIALGVDRELQTSVPGYTEAVQERVEGAGRVTRELERLSGARAPEPVRRAAGDSGLPDFGVAPEFRQIDLWLNSAPLSLAALRGKVVLIDFWTYSCINCLRTLPHLTSWDARYRSSGLVIVGVHTPEFAFERKAANVRENVRRLGIRYPVALDNGYGTWTAWANRYWPAKYLIDRAGHVRYVHFGEGEYAESEEAIRALLAERGASLPQPGGALADATPHGHLTPESYLGYERIDRYAGSPLRPDREHEYRLPKALGLSQLGYGGRWTVERERIVAGRGARLRLRYQARDVYLVLAGRGTVRAFLDGSPAGTTRVTADRLYTLVRRPELGVHELELRFAPGVEAFAFTFG